MILLFALVFGCEQKQEVAVALEAQPLLFYAEISGQTFAVERLRFAEVLRLEGDVEGVFLKLLADDVIRFRKFTEVNRGGAIKISLGEDTVASVDLPQRIDDGTFHFRCEKPAAVVSQLQQMETGDPGANQAVRDLLKVVR